MGLLGTYGRRCRRNGPPHSLINCIASWLRGKPVAMNSTTTYTLFALIVTGFVIDMALGLGGTLFILKELFDLTEWLAFWR